MAGIPQVITSDRASGAQVIDGSLKFDASAYLSRTPSSAGNRNTWTWSGWVKRSDLTTSGNALFAAYDSSTARDVLRFDRSASGAELNLQSSQGSSTYGIYSDAKLRDTGWYHVVAIYDDTNSTTADKQQLYVNGERLTDVSTENNGQDGGQTTINNTDIHYIGARSSDGSISAEFDGAMSQVYFIDGQALGPEYFGFTDPLTNTWKPKKFIPQATPNNGTTWSSGAGSNFESARPASVGFNGDPETFTRTDNASVTATVTLPSSVPFTTLQVRGARDSGNGTITINGTDVSSQFTSSSSTLETVTITGVTSPLTSIALTGISGSAQPRFSQIIVDGVTLIDGDTANMGRNGFYLPFDGNSPIGQDKSGNGNDWTPVNFGGSVVLDSPQVSGAKPILNTTPGGTQAGVGVFGSKQNVGYAVTVYDDGGGNKYYIDGVKQATLTGLIRGATYTFDTSDSTVSSHPFRFSESDGGSQYTNGVAAITGAATTITIPYNSSNELYYYCTSHSGMGSSITGITTNEKLADQYASHCTLALPLFGSDDDVCVSIACTSNNKTPTNSSVDASSTKSNFYGGSHHWSANSDTLQYAEQGDELVFGTGDFTIECWVYDDNGHNGGGSGRCYIFDNRIGGSVVGDPPTMIGHVDSHNEFNFYDGTNTITHTVGTTVGKWWHYAVTREGTTTRMFIDGILRGSATSSTNFTNNGIGVGRATDGGYGWAGYIQDFRVYKGIAKYTSDFVIPATSPDVLPDTPSGVSGGSKLTKITDGSFASPDSRDALQVQDSDDLAFGTGEFTVEMFFYANTVSGNDVLYDSRAATGSPADGFSIVRNSDQLRTYTSGDYAITPSTFRVASNRWYHLAITRESTTQKMYIDGVLVGSATVSNDFSQPKATVGSDVNGSEEWDGFISSFRLIKGTALYTANFTPPTAPLTNVTNTKLLCCQSNTSQTESTVIPDVTQFPAPYSAANKFSSIKYYTTVKQNQTSAATLPMSNPSHYQGNALDLASGGFQITTVNSAAEDFFMGMWVHFDTYGTSKQFGVDIANNYVYFETQSSGAIKIRHTGDGGSTSSNTSLNDGNWHHIALSRTGDTLYGFVDGTAVVSDSGGLSGNNSVAANSKFNFWGADNNFTSYNIDGQIIDAFIYIGKGVSSYTTPTAPLVGSDGTINHYSGFTDSDAYFISPCVDVTGSSANSLSGFFKEVAGADTGSATTFNPFNTDINTVRGQETGYATLNPLSFPYSASGDTRIATVSNGNLTYDGVTSYWGPAFSTIPLGTTGKYYFETIPHAASNVVIGVGKLLSTPGNRFWDQGTGTQTFYYSGGNIGSNGSTLDSSPASIAAFDVIGFAMDCDNNEGKFYKNGVLQATVSMPGAVVTAKDAGTVYPFCDTYNGTDVDWNFGQKPFKFPPPDGFQPLNTANTRPVKVISRPDQYVGVSTWSGDNVDGREIDMGMAPDLIWVKTRNQTNWHWLTDTVRGAPNKLYANSTNAEDTTPIYGQADSFTYKGWIAGGGTDGSNPLSDSNQTGTNYVCWGWKAGGDKNTFNVDDVGYATAAAAGFTAGDTTITGASVGTKQGFSIIKYTGPNDTNNHEVPHGLSQAPDFIIAKNLDTTYNWDIYHSSLADDAYLIFTNAATRATGFNGRPTSTVFNTEHDYSTNENQDYIAYCWHDVPGLQKFGSYEGNENTGGDGPFVELGFRPAIIWIKNSDQGTSAADWVIYDSERNKFNPSGKQLYPNRNIAEADDSNHYFDILSNGFKVRSTSTSDLTNATDTYIYCAWAEAPTVDLYGGGANAR